jgi:hypothetical protein
MCAAGTDLEENTGQEIEESGAKILARVLTSNRTLKNLMLNCTGFLQQCFLDGQV